MTELFQNNRFRLENSYDGITDPTQTSIRKISTPSYTELMPRSLTRSRHLQQRAEKFLPGGVDSPVRAFRAVGGDPPFVSRAEGA